MKIFIDTEFTDFIGTELISIGAVTEDGREFYAELTDYNKSLNSGFVNAHIVPLLGQDIPGAVYAPGHEVAVKFGNWIEDLVEPVKICVDYITDWDLAVGLLEDCWPSNLSGPCENIYADMQMRCVIKNTVLSLDDVMLDKPPIHTIIKKQKELFNDTFMKHFEDRKHIPGYVQHHALFDARANREGWLAALEFLRTL